MLNAWTMSAGASRRLTEVLDAAAGEICGIFLGHGVAVSEFLPLHNADQDADRFALADADVRHAHRYARQHDLEVLALVHSHPRGPVQLSREDLDVVRSSTLPWAVVVQAAPHHSAEGALFAAGSGRRIASLQLGV